MPLPLFLRALAPSLVLSSSSTTLANANLCAGVLLSPFLFLAAIALLTCMPFALPKLPLLNDCSLERNYSKSVFLAASSRCLLISYRNLVSVSMAVLDFVLEIPVTRFVLESWIATLPVKTPNLAALTLSPAANF